MSGKLESREEESIDASERAWNELIFVAVAGPLNGGCNYNLAFKEAISIITMHIGIFNVKNDTQL